jgi:hypothetical protein
LRIWFLGSAGVAESAKREKCEMPYEAKLPDGMPSLKIDTGDERYRALEALATTQKWTQETFSSVLGIEG